MAIFAWVRGVGGKLHPQVIHLFPQSGNDLFKNIVAQHELPSGEEDWKLEDLAVKYPIQKESLMLLVVVTP